MVYCAHRFRSLIHFPELQATPWARISWSLREFRSWFPSPKAPSMTKALETARAPPGPAALALSPPLTPDHCGPPSGHGHGHGHSEQAGYQQAPRPPGGLCSCRPGRRRTPNRDTALFSPVRPTGRVGLALPARAELPENQ